MKRVFIYLLFILFLANCTSQKETNVRTVLSGNIENPLSDVVTVSNGDLLFTDSLDENGNFLVEIEIEKPLFFRLRHGEYTTFYIRPGDSLNITLNTDEFDETIKYSGDGAELSQFSASMVLYNDTAINFRELMVLDESEFLAAVDQIESNCLQLLTDAALLDGPFIDLQKEIFQLVKGRYLLSYENAHSNYAELDSFSVSDGFYTPLAGIDVNDANKLDLFEFRRYLSAYLDNNAEKAYQQIEHPTDGDYYRLFMEAIEQHISNPEIKKDLHFSHLDSYPFTYVDDETRAKWIDYFEALSPDSAKLAKIKLRQQEIDRLKPGNTAPGFTYETIGGESVSLSDLAGSFVYVDVWATWCGPCLRELPHLEKLQDEFKDKNVKFVSVSIDNNREPWRKMVAEKEMKGIQLYAIGAWESDIIKDYMIGGIPRFILIDTEGKIIDASAERPSGEIGNILKELLESA